MGLPWCTWLIIGSVWCMNGIYARNMVQRSDDVGDHLDKFENDLSSFEERKFFDVMEAKSQFIESTKPPGADEVQGKMFVLFVQNDNYTGANNDSTPLDSWSVVWYVASFGGLIVFFLIVSCSEWCCRRAIRNSQNCNRTTPTVTTPNVPDTPPPSYDQFAPPSYESICLGRNGRGAEKSEYDIFVVPVHTLGSLMESRQEDAPPSYFTASYERNFVPAVTTLGNNHQVSRVT